MDDFKELYTPAASAISDKVVQSMSRQLGHRSFESEQEARDWLFDTLEHWDRQSWAHIFGVEGPAKNRWFADNFPIYQDRYEHWRLGRPLSTWSKEKQKKAYLARRATEDAEEKRREAQFKRDYPGWHYYPKIRRRKVQEYLSNMTSDFSDGTNGGDPVSRPPSTGDFGTSAGLPDYKYIERTHAEKTDRLRRLLARRDPGGISKNPYDVALRRSLGDSIEDEEGLSKELAGAPLVFRPQAEGPGRREHFLVELPMGTYLGTIFLDDLSPTLKTTPTLRRMWTEFPWISIPGSSGDPGRHRTKADAITRVVNHPAGGNPYAVNTEYAQRLDQVHTEEKAKMQEGEESFKDVFFTSKPIGWVARRKLVTGPERFYYVYFARWTERNSNWSQYIGDSRIFKRKATWMKWEGAKHGYWEILPIYHDPSKYGDRALTPEPPRRLFYPTPKPVDPDLPFAEALEDDDLVKDVSGVPPKKWRFKIEDDPDYPGLWQANFWLEDQWHGVIGRSRPDRTRVEKEARYWLRKLNAKEAVEPYPNHLKFTEPGRLPAWEWIGAYRYGTKKWPKNESLEDDDLVKDVTSNVNSTLDEFVKNYDVVLLTSFGRNTFHKYFDLKNGFNNLIRRAEDEHISTAYEGGHLWSLIRYRPTSVLPGVITVAPVVLHSMDAFEVIGYALSRVPGQKDNPLTLVGDDVREQIGYI